jgi:hypothetical protein
MGERLMKELRQIRNLLMLIALKLEASTDQVGKATGIGPNNVSTLVPQRRNKKNKKTKR